MSNDPAYMQRRWDALHDDPRFRPEYPHDQVVRWARRSFPRAGSPQAQEGCPQAGAGRRRVLDLGCGAGRHAVFLAREGFETYACDLSERGLAETRARAAAAGLTIATVHCAADDLSAFPDAFFDGVIAIGVLYHLPEAAVERAVAEVRRVLRPAGRFLCMTRTDRDARRAGAQPVSRCSWRVTGLPDGAPSAAEIGMTMTFLPEDEVRRLLAGFAGVTLQRMTVADLDRPFVDDDWIISAVMPAAAGPAA